MLHYNLMGDGEPEVEAFSSLQLALIRLQELSCPTDQPNFVATIIYDNQDNDGNIYDVVYFSDHSGYEFDTTPLPLSSLKGHRL